MSSRLCFRFTRLSGLNKVTGSHLVRPVVTLAPTDPLPLPAKEAEFREKFFNRIGNRDIVGFGRNGQYYYMDSTTFPYPAIRWEQNTGRTAALMEKAQGDWKNLTLEEQKVLYRHSFRQTFAELNAPNSEWKIVCGLVCVAISVSCWIYLWMKSNVYDAMLPSTINRDHQRAQEMRMIAQRQGPVTGVSSRWDYEAGDWKKK